MLEGPCTASIFIFAHVVEETKRMPETMKEKGSGTRIQLTFLFLTISSRNNKDDGIRPLVEARVESRAATITTNESETVEEN